MDTTYDPSPSPTELTPVSTLEKKKIETEKLHTISLLVQNKPGVLVRIAVIFSRRGYNIDSLVVSTGLKNNLSRITIAAYGSGTILTQVIKQCRKLVNVISASEYQKINVVEKEIALVKIISTPENRSRLFQYINHFKGETQDITTNSVIVLVTGSSERIDAFTDVIAEFEIIELIRSGKMIMNRGSIPT